MDDRVRAPWKPRLAQAFFVALVAGVIGAILQPGAAWLVIALSITGGLVWFALEPLVRPRRAFRDPVREDSITATEQAIRLAEAEIEAKTDNRA